MSKLPMKIQYNLEKKEDLLTIHHKSEKLVQLLENNGEEYYKELCNLKEKYTNEEIKKLLNDTHYISYMGNHLHALIYLVGDLVKKPMDGVYGTKTSVSEELGIKILEKFIEYDMDFNSKNYYNETPLENINSNGYTKRKNNNKFKKELENYYINNVNKTLRKIDKCIQ